MNWWKYNWRMLAVAVPISVAFYYVALFLPFMALSDIGKVIAGAVTATLLIWFVWTCYRVWRGQ